MKFGISIIMPVKNASTWLDACIISIVNQTFESWELIAIDDNSNDHSLAILQQWSEKDQRISVHKNHTNGIIGALELGLSLSKGMCISRMDADDLMPPDKLKEMYAACIAEPDSVITGKVKYFSDKQISEGYKAYEQWINERSQKNDHSKWIYRECTIAGANWLAPKHLVQFADLHYPEDYDLVFWWYKKKVKIVGLNTVTHLWREHPKRTSRNSANYAQNAFFQLKIKRFIEIDRDPKRPLLLLGKNQKAKLTAKLLSAHKCPFETLDLETVYKLNETMFPQVLVAVFPAESMRVAIADLLTSHKLNFGSDWWWL